MTKDDIDRIVEAIYDRMITTVDGDKPADTVFAQTYQLAQRATKASEKVANSL